jgi:hypothetical protein
MPFSRTDKATVYNRPAAVSGQESAEIRKRDEDLKITGRRLCKPIEAHPDHKKRFEIDKWDLSPQDRPLKNKALSSESTTTSPPTLLAKSRLTERRIKSSFALDFATASQPHIASLSPHLDPSAKSYTFISNFCAIPVQS